MSGSFDWYTIALLLANGLGIAGSIVILAAIYHVSHVVRHSCLTLIGFSCVMGIVSQALVLVINLPLSMMPAIFDTLYYTSCIFAIFGTITFTVGIWQLLHWIPQLLELKALDARDEPFRNDDSP
jgi:hypothetical protein